MSMTLPLAQEVVPGCTLLGRYRVLRKIGEGGFGRVYEAERLLDRQPVALKIGRGSEHEGRMDREARLAALLRSPHSVRVLGVEQLDDRSPMIVMELLHGISLKEYLAMRGRVEPRLAVAWALQLTEALEEAHGIGLVHRDIKPSNLFLVESDAESPSLKLLDFGLARAPGRSDECTVTRSDLLLGSPAYMSPEQIRGGEVSPHIDIWSFGVVLYEMLSGGRPFQAIHDAGLLAAITADVPTSLADLCPHLPVGLSRLVDRCLCKNAPDRFADTRELAEQLQKVQRTLDGAPSISWTESLGETSAIARKRSLYARLRRPKSWVTAVEFGALALGLGFWLVRLGTGDARQAPAAADPSPSVSAASSFVAQSPTSTAHVASWTPEHSQEKDLASALEASPPKVSEGARRARLHSRAPAPASQRTAHKGGPSDPSLPARSSGSLFAEPDF